MIVDAGLDGLQKRGFSMIAAANNQRDTVGDRHAAHIAAVGQADGPLHGLRRLEPHAVGHGQLGDAALSGENRAVGHESRQVIFGQILAHGLLVLGQTDDRLHLRFVQIGKIETCLHTFRQKIHQNLVQLPGVDGAPEGRESHVETGDDRSVFDLTGAALQDLLAAAGDGDEAALSGAFGLEIIILELSRELSGQMIPERGLRALPRQIALRKSRRLVGDLHVEAGGRREGVSLDMVDDQDEFREPPGSGGGFVGRVTLAVDGAQQGAQFCRRFHMILLSCFI